jgi:hypothetical protein
LISLTKLCDVLFIIGDFPSCKAILSKIFCLYSDNPRYLALKRYIQEEENLSIETDLTLGESEEDAIRDLLELQEDHDTVGSFEDEVTQEEKIQKELRVTCNDSLLSWSALIHSFLLKLDESEHHKEIPVRPTSTVKLKEPRTKESTPHLRTSNGTERDILPETASSSPITEQLPVNSEEQKISLDLVDQEDGGQFFPISLSTHITFVFPIVTLINALDLSNPYRSQVENEQSSIKHVSFLMESVSCERT